MTSPLQSVSGLASGLDTATIVSQLMSIERQPLVRLQQQQYVETARRTALQTVQTKLQTLSAAIDDLKSAGAWADTQTVDSSNASVLSATRTGGAAAGAAQVWIEQLARADQLTSATEASTWKAQAGTLSISVGAGTAIKVDVKDGDTLATIASRINGSSDIPVYATVMTVAADGSQQLVLSGKTTGDAAVIKVADAGAGPGTPAADLFGAGAATRLTGVGQDAVLSLKDPASPSFDPATDEIRNATNSVDNLLAGLKLTLKSVGSATITVGAPGPDTKAVQDKLQAFVTAYNDATSYISTKLNEQRPANPQNDSDRAIGVLAGDPGLSALLSDLRGAIGQPLAGAPKELSLLAQAGLSTGATTGSGALDPDAIAGKLTLDTDKLGTALAANLDGVETLVTAKDGLVDRLKHYLDPWLLGDGKHAALLTSRIQSSSDTIKLNTSDQADLQIRLDAYQQRLQAQFTAMETALSQTQSQAQWLNGQLAAL